MIDLTTTNEVVKQRALGLSFDDIHTVTGVSKPTIIKICNDRIDDITDAKANASTVAKADIATAISKRRLQYTKLVNRGVEELLGRDLTTMSNSELLKVIYGAEKVLATLESNDKTTDRNPNQWRPMEVEQAMAILDRLGD